MANTPQRAIRVPEEVWRPALVCAEARGETLTGVIRRALITYTAEHCGAGQ